MLRFGHRTLTPVAPSGSASIFVPLSEPGERMSARRTLAKIVAGAASDLTFDLRSGREGQRKRHIRCARWPGRSRQQQVTGCRDDRPATGIVGGNLSFLEGRGRGIFQRRVKYPFKRRLFAVYQKSVRAL